MRKMRRNTGLWSYLNSQGLLEKGDTDAIAKGKKDYWRTYDRNKKAEKRKQKRVYSVSFHTGEIKGVLTNAKAKGMKVAEYIREATRADMRNTYVIPYPHTVKAVEQILVSYRRYIKDIAAKDKKNWLGVNRNYDSLEQTISKMEQEVFRLFSQAPSLKNVIEDTLRTNPDFIHILIKIVKKNGGQEHDTEEI